MNTQNTLTAYRVRQQSRKVLCEHKGKHLEAGVIELAQSELAGPIVLVH